MSMVPFTDFDYDKFANSFSLSDDGRCLEWQDTENLCIEVEAFIERRYKMIRWPYDCPPEYKLEDFDFSVRHVKVTDENGQLIPFVFDESKLYDMVLELCKD